MGAGRARPPPHHPSPPSLPPPQTGRDPRLSGPDLDAAFAAGAATEGAVVARFGLATTPAMFLACIEPGHEYDAGVMATASHLPWNRNGFKFFTAAGGFDSADVAALLTAAASAHADAAAADPALTVAAGSPVPHGAAFLLDAALALDGRDVRAVDFMPAYAAHLRSLIVDGAEAGPTPLTGLRIAVDAGNGGGGFLATDVLAPLGADVAGSQFLDPDGRFPNHVPNPEDRVAMRAAVAMTRAARAHLGIILDTDVDRSAVVSASGDPINSNRYIALLAARALAESPGATIVTDSVTSDGLAEFIRALGGTHVRFKRGYKNVINKGVELNKAGVDCPLMMETSGHGASRDNHYLDDGTYSASQVVIMLARAAAAGESLDVAASALAGLREAADSVEIRLKVAAPDFKASSATLLQGFHDWVASGGAGEGWELEAENFEGWRVRVAEPGGPGGWILLRGSLHDPLLVLNAESSVAHGTCAIVGRALEFFEASPRRADVDIDALYDGASACTLRVGG